MHIVDITDPDLQSRDRFWRDYHRTDKVLLGKRWALRSGDAGPGREDIAGAAAELRAWLQDAQEQGATVRPVGGAWSPSKIQFVGEGGWMLNTRRFNRCFRIAQADLSPTTSIAAESLLLVEAGVQIDEINDRLECDMKRSLRSTGASNGQTLAGACATGTHGSVLEAGGIQDHVRAIQIVTPGEIHWIEPEAGLMSDDFIDATGSTALRDDEAFAAALVAVGSLGVVTAMVIETVPRYLVRPILKLIDFRRDDLDMLAAGDFLGFSTRHGLPQEPYFVMVVTNPHKPFRRKAVVRFLYKSEWESGYEAIKPAELGAGYDSFTMLGWLLRNFPLARGWILQKIMELAVGKGITEPVFGTWGETTEIHKPLADIFTGALFCDRADLARAFTTACGSFAGAGGATVMTLRFMKGGPGLLSPARWENTVGIDCDGPQSGPTKKAYGEMLKALDDEGVVFTRHWGKHNELGAARVASDYGVELARWKAVRNQLLPNPADLRLFAAPALDRLGLTI